jgi:hypothetical protein
MQVLVVCIRKKRHLTLAEKVLATNVVGSGVLFGVARDRGTPLRTVVTGWEVYAGVAPCSEGDAFFPAVAAVEGLGKFLVSEGGYEGRIVVVCETLIEDLRCPACERGDCYG